VVNTRVCAGPAAAGARHVFATYDDEQFYRLNNSDGSARLGPIHHIFRAQALDQRVSPEVYAPRVEAELLNKVLSASLVASLAMVLAPSSGTQFSSAVAKRNNFATARPFFLHLEQIASRVRVTPGVGIALALGAVVLLVLAALGLHAATESSRESEERFARIFRSSPLAITIST
jgi:hypothetical protein